MDHHHVDIAGAQRHALIEHARALVDGRQQDAALKVFGGEIAGDDGRFAARLRHNGVDSGIGDGLAIVITVEAPPGLLAEATGLAEPIRDGAHPFVRIAGRGEALAGCPADVEARHVLHGEQPHGKAERAHRRVDRPRACPIEHRYSAALR